MKTAIFLLLITVITINSAWAVEAPFKHGVNLTEWFQSPSVRQVQFTKFTKQDFIDIKNLGCDVVRLPINLHAMTSGQPDYTIDPLLFYLLDQVVDWTEDLDMNLILDNHSSVPDANTEPNIVDTLVPVWTQMADHYKNRSNHIFYEVLNEPHGISDQIWNNIQETVIDAIRTVDPNHAIIVGPANWNSYKNLDAMPYYSDDKLIYTFHFYDPFIFTHQGASWTKPSLENLVGVPFPYSYEKMPQLPYEYYHTWVEDAYIWYDTYGRFRALKEAIQTAAEFKQSRNVPLYCGEFGVYRKNCFDEPRDLWYFYVRMYFDTYGISWTTWDYKGGFGIFKKDTYELIDYDLNVTLAKLLGFHTPPQEEFVIYTDIRGFDIYSDYVASNILESSGLKPNKLDYYSENNPLDGKFCIRFTGVDQYGKISLRFIPYKGLWYLVYYDYVLDFYVRSNNPDTKFDVRFVDTKKTDNPYDHPWRMRYKIDDSVAIWDGQWNHVRIPLKDFVEHGSFDNGMWYDPVGAFEWGEVDKFEIVSEYGNLNGTDIYFDDISIAAP